MECEGGLIYEELARRGAWSLIGIEPSKDALATVRFHSRQSGLGQKTYYQHGYSESLPYADGGFSAIVCFDALKHVRDSNASIREIVRVLAPGGVFVFDTINRTLIARAVLIWYGEHFPSGGLTPGLHNYHNFIEPCELLPFLVENGCRHAR